MKIKIYWSNIPEKIVTGILIDDVGRSVRNYEIDKDNIEKFITEYLEYTKTPIPNNPYLDLFIIGKLKSFIEDVENALERAKEPMVIA